MDLYENSYRLSTLLTQQGLSIATAESCTGGLIAGAITDIAGSSRYFMGGIVAYDNKLKENILKVPQQILETHGAVSEQCVRAMLKGTAIACNAKCTIAVSGIAGPGGGTPDKPLGLVYIGWLTPTDIEVKEFHFSGDRNAIRQVAVREAIKGMIEMLSEGIEK